jgi:two-component system LytT family response regulator
MKIYRTLIIDDEPLARQRLRRLLEQFSERVELIGEADSGVDALEKIAALQPELIFLDIQMPGKNGFEVLQELSSPPLIIFVTAYDEFALRAFEVNAIDYLLKPVKKERLTESLARLQKRDRSTNPPGDLEKLLAYISNKPKFLNRIPVRKRDRILFLNAAEVLFIKAGEKYTFVVTEERQEIVDYTLTQLEEKLDSQQFMRIHRSHIINLSYLRELRRSATGQYAAVLKNASQSKLPISRGYLKKVLAEISD